MSAQEPIKYFEGIDPHNPETYRDALNETDKWWINFSNKNYGGADVSGITNQVKQAIKNIEGDAFAVAPSPYIYIPT